MLFVDGLKLVKDDRFELMQKISTSFGSAVKDFTLRLSFTEANDTGEYECQLSTSPKLSTIYTLNVVGEWKTSIVSYFVHKQ